MMCIHSPSRAGGLVGSFALALAITAASAAGMAHAEVRKDPESDPLVMRAGFLAGHPDLRFRMLGLEELDEGRPDAAFRYFKRASLYGDKPSQAMVAEMLWKGQGTPQDRSEAYVWIDLAAERGYVTFLTIRERYWAALDESERAHALDMGQSIYARYGDTAAQPRLDAVLRRESRKTTGSRLGFVGNLKILVPGPMGFEQIDGSKYYDPQYWDPKRYREWQDTIWKQPRTGQVNVGDVEKVEPQKPAK